MGFQNFVFSCIILKDDEDETEQGSTTQILQMMKPTLLKLSNF